MKLADKLRQQAARRQQEPTVELTGLEAAQAERDEFEAGFRRQPSGKRNLTRIWNGRILTVFPRGECFSWCISGDEPRFASRLYECEADAIGGLAGELEVGLW